VSRLVTHNGVSCPRNRDSRNTMLVWTEIPPICSTSVDKPAIIVGIGAVFRGPAGFVTWRRTSSRAMAIAVTIGAAVVGLLVVGYIYLSVVLCPPGAGCA